jgi:hypothetical protein
MQLKKPSALNVPLNTRIKHASIRNIHCSQATRAAYKEGSRTVRRFPGRAFTETHR